ncbi:ATP-dependent DNA ligase, partial [Nocardioides plantarum]
MLLIDVVTTSSAVAATRSRKQKVAVIADLLSRAAAGPELEVVTSYVGGALLQRRTGVGWRGLASLPDPAAEASLTVVGVDATFERLARISGPGSQAARAAAVTQLFAAATADEQSWLRGLVTGELRQGALDALVQEGLAVAVGLPVAAVRRAAMLAGSTVAIARAAVEGGETALAAIGLEVG